MGFRVKLKCPDCAETFVCTAATWPDRCPLCGFDTSLPDDDVISMPALRRAVTTANDKVYRDIEASSERRAEAAAEMAGTSVAEMASLKITDLNSTRHAGDIAAKPVVNEVSRMIEANPGVMGFRGGQGVEYSGAVQTGPYPNMGAQMRTLIQGNHRDMVMKHAVGTDATTGRSVIPSTDVVSERPANETMQPGYRRRG